MDHQLKLIEPRGCKNYINGEHEEKGTIASSHILYKHCPKVFQFSTQINKQKTLSTFTFLVRRVKYVMILTQVTQSRCNKREMEREGGWRGIT